MLRRWAAPRNDAAPGALLRHVAVAVAALRLERARGGPVAAPLPERAALLRRGAAARGALLLRLPDRDGEHPLRDLLAADRAVHPRRRGEGFSERQKATRGCCAAYKRSTVLGLASEAFVKKT